MDENSTGKETESQTEKSCGTHTMCRPHTSLYLSIIALLLAAYAAITASSSVAPSDGEARLSLLERNVESLNEQVVSLGKDVESNRENLIQTKLKKALLNIREVSDLAKEETKATIAEVEKVLRDLTSLEEATVPAAKELSEPDSASENSPATVKPDVTGETEAANDPTAERAAAETSIDQKTEVPVESAPEPTDMEPAAVPASETPTESSEDPAAVMPDAQEF